VEWFNAVDETYQRQLKEVNDLNWQRVETRFGAFGERLDVMSSRFDEKLDTMESHFNDRLDAVATRVELVAFEVSLEARLDAKMQRLRSELVLWMFGFWTATVVPLAALMLTVSGAFRR